MIIGQIKNGIVLDHITAGRGMDIYNILHLGELDCTVAMIKNAESQKMGQKDIIKIGQSMDLNLDILGYIDPGITVDIIRDGKRVEKKAADPAGNDHGRDPLQKSALHHFGGAGTDAYFPSGRPEEQGLPLHLLRQRRAPLNGSASLLRERRLVFLTQEYPQERPALCLKNKRCCPANFFAARLHFCARSAKL